MREVEVAVGFTDHTWRDLWVTVPHDEDTELDLDDEETQEIAEKMALEVATQADWSVSFIKTLYMEPPDDPLDGIV